MTVSCDVVCHQEPRDQWLLERKKGIGASDAPKILGVTKAGGQASLYLEKTRPGIEDDGAYYPELAELGRELEAWALRKVLKDYNRAAEEAGEEDWHSERDGRLYRSSLRPWQLCTLDGNFFRYAPPEPGRRIRDMPVRSEEIPTEVKTRAFPDQWQASELGVPPDVFVQVQHQMSTIGAPRVLVGVVFRVSGRRAFVEVERDEEFIGGVLIPACEKFWRAVVDKDPTDLESDQTAAGLRAMQKLFPSDPALSPVRLTAEYADLADELEAAREHEKEWKEKKRALSAKISEAIGTAEIGVLPDTRYFIYRTQDRKGHTVKPSSPRPLLGPYGSEGGA